MGQTTQLLQRLAEHNRNSNSEMLKVVVDHIEDPWNFKLESYHFQTLGQILDHSYVVDINWMHHIQSCSRGVIDSPFRGGQIDHNSRHFEYFNDYKRERTVLDREIIEFFCLVKEEHLIDSIGQSIDGQSVPWLPAIHLFNHQTHHRGQISNILDTLGIPNDYSSIIRM